MRSEGGTRLGWTFDANSPEAGHSDLVGCRGREKKEEGARRKMRRGRKTGQEEEGKGEEAGVGEGEWLVCKLHSAM